MMYRTKGFTSKQGIYGPPSHWLGACAAGGSTLGAQRPEGPPGPGRGPGFLWKKAGRKNTKALPWTRISRPLVPTRWIWRLYASEWLQNASFRYTKTDLDRIFRENTLKKNFAKECLQSKVHTKAPQQGNSCPLQPPPQNKQVPTGGPSNREATWQIPTCHESMDTAHQHRQSPRFHGRQIMPPLLRPAVLLGRQRTPLPE